MGNGLSQSLGDRRPGCLRSSAGRRCTCFVFALVLLEALLLFYKIQDVHVWNLPTKMRRYFYLGEPCFPPGNEEKAKEMKEALFLFADWSQSVNLRYWIDFGTLLGAVRDGNMIPWDWDVDVGVMKEDIVAMPELPDLLKSHGLLVRRSSRCRLAICLARNNESCLDVFMHVIRKADNFVIRCELDDVFRYQFPASFVQPTKPIMFEGHMVQGPNHPEEMLKLYRYPYSYGWAVPMKFDCYFTEWKYFQLFVVAVVVVVLPSIFVISFCCYKM